MPRAIDARRGGANHAQDPAADRRRRRGAGDLLRQVPPRGGGLARSTSSRPTKRTFLSVVHDFEPGFDTYTEKPGYRVEADLGLDEVDPSAYDGLVLPGGRAPGVPAEPAEGRGDRPPLRRGGQADRGQLPRSAARHRGRRGEGEDDDLLPRPRARRPRGRGASSSTATSSSTAHLVTVRGWPDNGPWMREFVKLMKATRPLSRPHSQSRRGIESAHAGSPR